MPEREVWDVEPREGRWAVQREGSKRADSIHPTKPAAVERGVELAKTVQGQLRIKGADGTIQDERTYGDDPYPSKG